MQKEGGGVHVLCYIAFAYNPQDTPKSIACSLDGELIITRQRTLLDHRMNRLSVVS